MEYPGIWQNSRKNLEKPGIKEILKKKTWKNLKILTFLTYSVVEFQFDAKSLSNNIFLSSFKLFY